MRYIVVEKKEGHGWLEHLECSLEADAIKMVEGLYKDSKRRKENREFKYIVIEGNVEIPVEDPNEALRRKEARVDAKLSKIFKP